jgi:FlaA1/EpsC-like NDP-sugar epimerase
MLRQVLSDTELITAFYLRDDIEIQITGMRPGEKIYEELLTSDENLGRTPFDKLRVQKNANFDPDRIDAFIHDLKSNIELCHLKRIHDDIMQLIPEMTGPGFEEMMKNVFA